MSREIIRFKSELEAEAFEAGVWFQSPPPFETRVSGTIVTIFHALGGEDIELEFQWDETSFAHAAVGENPLTSRIHFPSVSHSRAFITGLTWYSDSSACAEMKGTDVVVQERRDGGEEKTITYDFENLHSLIVAYRARTTSMSA